MQLTRETAVDTIGKIVTGLENNTFEGNADEDNWAKGDEGFQELVNVVADLIDTHNKYMVLALAAYLANDSASLYSHELEDYVQERYQCSAPSVGEALQEYAQSQEGTGDGLYEMFDRLDAGGGVDYFDWDAFADSGSSYMSGVHLIKMPVTGLEADSVYVFTDR